MDCGNRVGRFPGCWINCQLPPLQRNWRQLEKTGGGKGNPVRYSGGAAVSDRASLTKAGDGIEQAARYAASYRKRSAQLKGYFKETATADALREVDQKFEAFYDAGVRMTNAYINGETAAGNRFMEDFDAAADHLNGEFGKVENPIVSAYDLTIADSQVARRRLFPASVLDCLWLLGREA